MNAEIIQGDCLDVMKTMDDNSIDFIVTDPPYGLHFMGKDWDKFKFRSLDSRYIKTSRGVEKIVDGQSSAHAAGSYDDSRNDEFQQFIYQVGKELLRIAKPGSMLAMFGAPRRHHRQMSGLEDAGWEIRDCIAWIFGQGFPKSHNFGRKLGSHWEGYGTALKPAYEPIILAMKPLDGTFKQNTEKWGIAGINIDACRIETGENKSIAGTKNYIACHNGGFKFTPTDTSKGRWPANIIFDEEAAEQLDQMAGILKSGSGDKHSRKKNTFMASTNWESLKVTSIGGDSGGASRFFYCAKASSAERNKGLDNVKHVLYNEAIDLKDEESNLWEELGLKANILQDSDILQKKDIIASLFGIQSQKVLELLCIMFTYGKRPSGRLLRVLMYTMLMRINKTIELKIFNLLINWSIKESIQDARSLMEYGINPANYVQHSSKLIKIIGILQERGGLNTEDVDPVTLVKSWLKKEQEKLEKELLNHNGGHPTVKPIALMKYIIKLLAPPGDPLLLDPFAGSGSTLCAAKELGIRSIGIELSEQYCEIAKARIKAAKLPEPDLFDKKESNED